MRTPTDSRLTPRRLARAETLPPPRPPGRPRRESHPRGPQHFVRAVARLRRHRAGGRRWEPVGRTGEHGGGARRLAAPGDRGGQGRRGRRAGRAFGGGAPGSREACSCWVEPEGGGGSWGFFLGKRVFFLVMGLERHVVIGRVGIGQSTNGRNAGYQFWS